MKEEKIIELLEGLGKQIHRRDGDWIVEMNSVCHVDSQGIIELISAVEQATLERAAKVCEEISDEYARTESRRYPELRTDAETGASDCEDAIRALKTKGE